MPLVCPPPPLGLIVTVSWPRRVALCPSRSSTQVARKHHSQQQTTLLDSFAECSDTRYYWGASSRCCSPSHARPCFPVASPTTAEMTEYHRRHEQTEQQRRTLRTMYTNSTVTPVASKGDIERWMHAVGSCGDVGDATGKH
eukprot:gene16806-biopygen17286